MYLTDDAILKIVIISPFAFGDIKMYSMFASLSHGDIVYFSVTWDIVYFCSASSLQSRYSILKANLRKTPFSDEIDLSVVSKYTQGFSGADLTEICQRVSCMYIRTRVHTYICTYMCNVCFIVLNQIQFSTRMTYTNLV